MIITVADVVSRKFFGSAGSRRDAQWMWANNEAYRAEWDRSKIQPFFYGFEPASTVGCHFSRSTTFNVLQSENVRAASHITEDFTSVGATSSLFRQPKSSTPWSEVLSTAMAPSGSPLATDTGVAQISEHIYDYGRGGNGVQEFIIGTTLWDTLPAPVQTAMLEASEEVTDDWYQPDGLQATTVMNACDLIDEAAGTVSRLSDDLIEEWREVAAPANEAKFPSIAGAEGPEFLVEYKATSGSSNPNTPVTSTRPRDVHNDSEP